MEKLISMSDFVLEQGNPSNTDSQFADKVMAYANFLKQPLTLEMFVPCDEDGNVLDEPNINDLKSKPFCESGDCKAYHDEIKEYQEAKQQVLFEGFEIKNQDKGFVNLYSKEIEQLLWDKKDLHFWFKSGYTIEKLIQDHELILSESAKQQLL